VKKFSFESQPALRLLTNEQIVSLHERALRILHNTGVKFDSAEALHILEEQGAIVDHEGKIAKFPAPMVLNALNQVPGSFDLYQRDGALAVELGGNQSYFDPGSAVLKFMESDGKTVRPTVAKDLVQLSLLGDALENIDLLSTALVMHDVPVEIGDVYRFYLILKNAGKATIGGAFSVEGIKRIRDVLAAAVGGYEELRARPRIVADICSSAPLKWTHISCQNVIDCARWGLPIEFISVPMPGACSPATLAGSVLVHTVEVLSGIVLAQCVSPGAKVVYGGAPMHFDMRYSTTSLSALEATMISVCYAQMGKYYGLPTHTYACLSDAKEIDAQAGLETGMSGMLALLGGINVISGPGVLDFCTIISMEKLMIDNDICGMVKRLGKGVAFTEETVAEELISSLGPGGDFLSTEHTFHWFKKEPYLPSAVIERSNRDVWEAMGAKTTLVRARERVEEMLKKGTPNLLAPEKAGEVDRVMKEIMKELKIPQLPFGPQ